MVRAQALGYDSCLGELVVTAGEVEPNGERRHRRRASRRGHRRHRARIEAAREQYADRHVADEVAAHRVPEQATELFDCLVEIDGRLEIAQHRLPVALHLSASILPDEPVAGWELLDAAK